MGRTFTRIFFNTMRVMVFAWLCCAGMFCTAKAQTISQTITFNPLPTMVYGDPVFSPGATASSGLPVTYISSDVTVAKVVNGNTIQIVGAGNAVITAEQPGNETYSRAVRVSRPLTVTKANVTVTAVSQTRAYGSRNATLTVSYTGLKNNETTITTKPTLATTATAASDVGAYDIVVSGGASNNYNITLVNGKINVTPAVLTITAANKTKLYGAVNPVLTATYAGFKNGDNSSKFLTQPVINTTATVNSDPGNYTITVSGVSINNYTVSYVNGTLTVRKGFLTVRVTNQTKTYGAANPVLAYTISGFSAGQTAANLTSPVIISTTSTQNSTVGSYPITASGAAAENYDINYVQGTLTVSRARLTIKANNVTRVYGDENPELTFTYTGFVLNETAAVLTQQPVASTTAIATSPAGSYNITVSDAAADNYIIAYSIGKLTVTKAPLIITADDKIRPYGAANPAFTFIYTGFLNGEDESVLTKLPIASTPAQVRSVVGTYKISPSGATAANYSITYVAGTLTIEKVLLTVKATDITRLYGATTPAFAVTYTGFVNGETATAVSKKPTFTSTATATSPVGDYTITPSAAIATNYDLVYETGILTIAKRTLTITAANKTRAYGRANPALTYTVSGLVNSERIADVTNGTLQISTPATTASVPETYPIELNELTADNYNVVTVNGTLTVTNAVLNITSANASKTYGQPNPQFRYTISGYVNGDNSSVFTQLPQTPTTTATAQSPAGTYSITTSGAVVEGYYDLKYNTGTLTINKVPLTVKANDAARTYGVDNPAFDITYTGFVNNDTEQSLSTQPTVATTATPTSPLGTYTLVPDGGVSPNYTFTYVNGTLTVTPGVATITFTQPPAKTYGIADFDPGATNNANEPIIYTSANPLVATIINNKVHITGVGNANITASFSPNSNYSGTLPVTQILTVNKALLTIKAENKSKVYGTPNPALTLTYTGFVNGENQTVLTTQPTAGTAATTGSSAGDYAITPSGATAANYELAYTNGVLTINKAQLTATAQNATRSFGTANPVFGVSYTGFVNNDNEQAIQVQAGVSTTATINSPIGNYALVPSGALAANYSFVYINGTLTITGGVATITFAPLPAKTFGDTDFDAGATSNVNEALQYSSSNTSVATIVNGKIHISAAGTAIITAFYPPSSGYSQTPPQTQLLVVNKAQQTITFAAIPLLSREDKYSLQNVTSSSGLPVTFTVADATIASIQEQVLVANQIGSTTITATQPGNNNYLPATAVSRSLEIKNVEGKIEIEVHRALSPNGDGINDVFFIEGITRFPQNKVSIYNRNGIKIFEIEGYDNASRAFNGRSNINGQMQQPGTYAYVIQFTANGNGRHVNGAFVLKY